MTTSDQQYYDNKDNWGESQFTTLEQVIDNIILLSDDDSYFKKIKRFRASIIGKQALMNFNLDIKQKPKAISFALGPNRTFPFPRYMENWNRISFVGECGKLQVIDVNNSPLVVEYLQDENYELLYDENGNVLNGQDKIYQKGNCIKFITCENGKLVLNPNPKPEEYWVKEVSESNYFLFSDDLVDKEIVIEFTSSALESLDDCDVKVHNRMADTLSYYIKWKLLESKRNTPTSEVAYNRDMYKLEKKKTRRFLSKKITIDQILESVSLRYNN